MTAPTTTRESVRCDRRELAAARARAAKRAKREAAEELAHELLARRVRRALQEASDAIASARAFLATTTPEEG